MEQRFIAAWMAAREQAGALGVALRPLAPEQAMREAHRQLSGNRASEGFFQLAQAGHPELTVEALAVDRRFTALFPDEEANRALTRLLDIGYGF